MQLPLKSACTDKRQRLLQWLKTRWYMKRQIVDDLLQPAILLFQLPQSPQLTDLQPTMLRLSAIVGPFADPVLPTHLRHHLPGLGQLQNAEDLLLAESTVAHACPPDRRRRSLGSLAHSLDTDQGVSSR